MVAFRTPGPWGLNDHDDLAAFGVAVPGQTGLHGPVGHLAGHGATRAAPLGAGASQVVALKRRTHGPARVPLLSNGSRGDDVRKLQALHATDMDKPLTLPLGWQPKGGVRVVAFLADQGSGAILGESLSGRAKEPSRKAPTR